MKKLVQKHVFLLVLDVHLSRSRFGEGEGSGGQTVGETGEVSMLVVEPVADLFGGEAGKEQVGAQVRFGGPPPRAVDSGSVGARKRALRCAAGRRGCWSGRAGRDRAARQPGGGRPRRRRPDEPSAAPRGPAGATR